MDLRTMLGTATAGRRRALLGLLFGGVAAVGGHHPASRAAKKKGKKGKKKCPTGPICPTCGTCPPRDTCPGRSCCVCNTSSDTPGCRFGADSDGSGLDLKAKCDAACGGPGTTDTGARTGTVGRTVACNANNTACVFVSCPL